MLDPSPAICAPIDRKHFTRSTISGSFAAFFKTDVPLAKVAAMMKFSVAPTDAIRISKVPAFNRPLDLACKYPSFKSILAPKASRAPI